MSYNSTNHSASSFNYELEFYKEENPRISMQLSRGSFVPTDLQFDNLRLSRYGEMRFDSPIPVQSGVKYAVRLSYNGGGNNAQIWYGKPGLSLVKGPDGTNFTFSDCSELTTNTYANGNAYNGLFNQILYSKNVTEAAISEVRLFFEHTAWTVKFVFLPRYINRLFGQEFHCAVDHFIGINRGLTSQNLIQS